MESNSIGVSPVLFDQVQKNNQLDLNKIAFWISLNVLILLLPSFFAKKIILLFFGITLNSLKPSEGLIITSSGFPLLTGAFKKHKGMKKDKVKEEIKIQSEISLTPLAIPMM